MDENWRTNSLVVSSDLQLITAGFLLLLYNYRGRDELVVIMLYIEIGIINIFTEKKHPRCKELCAFRCLRKASSLKSFSDSNLLVKNDPSHFFLLLVHQTTCHPQNTHHYWGKKLPRCCPQTSPLS